MHLEGTIRPRTLLDIAARNGLSLPASTETELTELYRFRDFAHFVEVWILTTNVLRTAADCRQVVVDYAAEAASYGAVYLEAIFSPIERVARGVTWAELFGGYCDGATEAAELHGVVVRLTPDVYRGCDPEQAEETARWAVRYRDRGVVGLGIGGLEADFPPEPYTRAFRIAREGGLGSVPHAGEVAGPESIRATIAALGADRLRHGVRALDDTQLVADLVDAGTVLDVCPISNLRTRVVDDVAAHPLPRLIAGRPSLFARYRRPRDVRHRPRPGARRRDRARRRRADAVRRRRRRSALRRSHPSPAGRHRGARGLGRAMKRQAAPARCRSRQGAR